MSWARSGALIAIVLLAGCTPPPPQPTEPPPESTRPAVSSPPSTTPAPSEFPAPSATTQLARPTAAPLDTTGWTTYVSEQYGFAIGHPRDWGVMSAIRSWTMEVDAGRWENPALEMFWAPDRNLWFSAWTAHYAGEESLAGVHRWVDEYCGRSGEPCGTDRTTPRVQLCNGRDSCRLGLLLPEHFPHAFFIDGVHERHMTVVASGRPPDWPIPGYGEALQVFEAFLSTMDVCPVGDQEPPGCDSDTPLAGAATGDPLTTERR